MKFYIIGPPNLQINVHHVVEYGVSSGLLRQALDSFE